MAQRDRFYPKTVPGSARSLHPGSGCASGAVSNPGGKNDHQGVKMTTKGEKWPPGGKFDHMRGSDCLPKIWSNFLRWLMGRERFCPWRGWNYDNMSVGAGSWKLNVEDGGGARESAFQWTGMMRRWWFVSGRLFWMEFEAIFDKSALFRATNSNLSNCVFE